MPIPQPRRVEYNPRRSALAALLALSCSACVQAPPTVVAAPAAAKAQSRRDLIPQPVRFAAALPRLDPAVPSESYSVVVHNVPVQELLFSLARDAKLNVDIFPGLSGSVSLNAVDQTLQQLLERISRQADLRWQLDGPNLSVMPDSPYLRSYRIDYVNMARETSGSTAVTTQIATAGAAGAATASGNALAAAGNNSQMRIESQARNRFWETLEKNLRDILYETDKILPEGSSETVIERNEQQATTGTGSAPHPGRGRTAAAAPAAGLAASVNPAVLQQAGNTVVRRTTFREAAAVIANAEAGVMIVRATRRQHDRVQEFLDQVMARAQRQVLIEATIVEVELADGYQQGIDWSALPLGRAGFRLVQRAAGNIAAPPSSFIELGYSNAASASGNLSASVRLLESFGRVRVLSSPKLSVLNNQTAVLKVVDHSVYFSIKAEVTPAVQGAQPLVAYSTTVNTVPVGFIMNVTPQIDDNDSVLLNVRPSISRIIASVADPNPDLARASVANLIPVIRVREMESMLRIDSGNIAVMGGLMEDLANNTDNAVPVLARVPVLGAAFQDRDDLRRKSELVVFLRPIVLRDTDLDGDYDAYRSALPDGALRRRSPL